jgi:carboxyl-terminal processing protease
MLLFIAFTAGVMADRAGWLPGSSRRQPAGLGHTFDPFWEAWNLVQAHYVDRSAVQPERMTQGAIEGMLLSLGDVGHTGYLTADEFQNLESGLKGQMEGIGARLTVRNRRPTIVQTMPGSPARAAGLKPGDAILEVNGKSVANLSLQQIVEQVRGPADTEVSLRVAREGRARPLDVKIRRARVEVPDVTWHMLPGTSIAHMAIQNFGSQADTQLRAAVDEARRQGARALLLDVRGNPGGLKEQAVAVTSEFIANGTVFIQQDARGNREDVTAKSGGIATDIPLCLLVDEGSASSAEIFAGAIQDHDRGKLVGTRTFGTGTVIQPFHLSDGSAVLLAVAEWLTPKGRQIWHQGVSPDVEVALPTAATILLPDTEEGMDAAALARSPDKQLLKALDVLKQSLGPAGGEKS